jgi:hypothetical protein
MRWIVGAELWHLFWVWLGLVVSWDWRSSAAGDGPHNHRSQLGPDHRPEVMESQDLLNPVVLNLKQSRIGNNRITLLRASWYRYLLWIIIYTNLLPLYCIGYLFECSFPSSYEEGDYRATSVKRQTPFFCSESRRTKPFKKRKDEASSVTVRRPYDRRSMSMMLSFGDGQEH